MASVSSLAYCLFSKARSLPYSGEPERFFKVLALPTDIRLGWKGSPWTNTTAYYKNLQITSVKSFITLGQGPESFERRVNKKKTK
jgi:hypothetical protein